MNELCCVVLQSELKIYDNLLRKKIKKKNQKSRLHYVHVWPKRCPHEETELLQIFLTHFISKMHFIGFSPVSPSSNAIYSIKFEHSILEIWSVYWYECKYSVVTFQHYNVVNELSWWPLIAAVKWGIEILPSHVALKGYSVIIAVTAPSMFMKSKIVAFS